MFCTINRYFFQCDDCSQTEEYFSSEVDKRTRLGSGEKLQKLLLPEVCAEP